ncbi:endonuclease III [Strigomonas culicis]|uniref:Endonuclease III homolog n=1 Tax=Strigomonas culicis TaxID=28005 RepID=S9WDB6_9TRYP|nr:endonuclease III [Strigomonas culicis]EPY37101.1 endonuclease III [Strigomonas culicis]|eukprot:EPY33727.1 endonuclease III [Strigomonas culicis]
MSAFKPPANWERLYLLLQQCRTTLAAPVDTMGCDRLTDAAAPKEVQRFHTLIALMLSAQTKDTVTAATMHELMGRGLTVQRVAGWAEAQLDGYIQKVGFHHTKAKHIKQVADILLRDHAGLVPRRYEEIIALPGVGPKMTHLFLQGADGQVLGIGVDTHVHRIARRFGWTPPTAKTPEDTRKCLEGWLPHRHWREINHLLVGLGQTVCAPIGPKCGECPLRGECPNAFREGRAAAATPEKPRSPSATTSLSRAKAKGSEKATPKPKKTAKAARAPATAKVKRKLHLSAAMKKTDEKIVTI